MLRPQHHQHTHGALQFPLDDLVVTLPKDDPAVHQTDQPVELLPSCRRARRPHLRS